MAATIEWHNSTAATATYAVVTKLRFRAANDNPDDLTNPLVKPTAGQTSYSFEKALRIYVAGGTFTQLSTLRVLLSTATIGTGITCYHGFQAQGSYTQPIGTLSTIATTLLSTTAINWGGPAGSHTTSPAYWNSAHDLYLQLRLADTVSGGEITDFSVIARYDEI
jgi:hypothetical protein